MQTQAIPLPYLGLLRAHDRERVPPDGAAEMENWIHRDENFQVRPGLTTFGNLLSQRPCGMVGFVLTDGTRRIVMGTDDSWWAYDNTTNTWSDLANGALTGGAGDQQVFRPFEQSGTTILLGTNSADNPKKWNGADLANNYADIGGSPPRAKAMMILADRVMLLNLKSGGTVSPLAVDISARLNFESGWQTFVSLLADTAGAIVGAREMGNFVGIIYKTDAIYRAIFQAGTNPFRYEMLTNFQESEGLCSALALTSLGDGSHVYMSRGGELKLYTGAGPLQSFGSRDVARYIQATAAIGQLERAWAAYDADNEEVLFVYPEKGNTEPNLGVIIKERGGAMYPVRWSGKNMTAGGFAAIQRGLRIGDLTMPIGSISQTLGELGSIGSVRRMILAASTGQAYEAIGDDDAGTGIPFFVESGLYDAGDPLKNKVITRIVHEFENTNGSQPISIKLGKSMGGRQRSLTAAKTINLQSRRIYATGHRTSARYISMRLEGTATQPVVWSGSTAEFEYTGAR